MAGNLTDEQRDILIKTILGEAAGEGQKGMEAVAHVILNRSKSGQYPSDPAKVAKQPYQFSTWNKGSGGNNPDKWKPGTQAYQTAAQALDAAFSNPDPTGGALMYHASSITPYWAGSANVAGTEKIGNHVFYPNPTIAALNDIQSADGIPFPRPSPTSSAGIMDALNQTNPPGSPFASTQNSGGFSGMGADLGLASSPAGINIVPMPRPRPNMQSGIPPLSGASDLDLAGNPFLKLSGSFDPNMGLGMAPDVGSYQMPSDFTGGSILPPMPRPRPGSAPNGIPQPAGLLQQQIARENAGQSPGQLGQAPQPAMQSLGLASGRYGYPGLPQLGVGFDTDQMYAGTIQPRPATMSPALQAQRGMASQTDNTFGAPMGGGGQNNLIPNFDAKGNVISISQPPFQPQGGSPFDPKVQQPNFMNQVFSGSVPPITPAPAVYTPPTQQPATQYSPDPASTMQRDYARDGVGGMTAGSIIPQIFKSGSYLYTANPGGGYTKVGRYNQDGSTQPFGNSKSSGGLFGNLFTRTQNSGNSSNGGVRPLFSSSNSSNYGSNSGGGLKPGDRKYNPKTNRWEVK